jgi:hypothetical protein
MLECLNDDPLACSPGCSLLPYIEFIKPNQAVYCGITVP